MFLISANKRFLSFIHSVYLLDVCVVRSLCLFRLSCWTCCLLLLCYVLEWYKYWNRSQREWMKRHVSADRCQPWVWATASPKYFTISDRATAERIYIRSAYVLKVTLFCNSHSCVSVAWSIDHQFLASSRRDSHLLHPHQSPSTLFALVILIRVASCWIAGQPCSATGNFRLKSEKFLSFCYEIPKI